MPEQDLDKLTSELQQLAEAEIRHTEVLRSDLPISREGIQRAEAEARNIKKRVEAKRAEITKIHDEIKAELEAREQQLRQQMAQVRSAVSTAMEPIEKVMKNLNEGLTSMGLYLGRGEQIFTIRDGQRADALTPIVLRQMVLAMDEETGIFAEDGGIDAARVEEFDQWLLEDERHVQQIVPEEKCIVALVPRWRERSEDRRGPMGNPEDRLTHFLIRNGECLFRTSVEFEAGERLIPAPDEFIQFFRRKRYFHDDEPEGAMKPGSQEYNEAMENSDVRSRHYLRIGLILQGLVDRTEIFHPLHPAGINFLVDPSIKHDAEKVRVILDGEGGLESGLQTFDEWRESTNEQLRVGMRIVGAFNTEEFRRANKPRGYEDRYSYRIYPNNAEAPPSGEPILLEKGQSGFQFKIRYPRTEKIWDGWGQRQSKLKAWCSIDSTDGFILAYDSIDAALMERFLNDRRSRRQYKELWPLMRSIWVAKRQEEQEEEPFHKMLAGVLARENKVSVEDAVTEIPDLVRWFKLANRYHRPLTLKAVVEDDAENVTRGGRRKLDAPDKETVSKVNEKKLATKQAHESKAVRLIVAEHRRRLKDRNRVIDERFVAAMIGQHPSCVAIVRPRRGGYIVLLPEDDRNIYVHEIEFTTTGKRKEDRRWRLIGSRAERWTVAYATERWKKWDRMANPQTNLTGPEIDAAVESIKQRSGEDVLAISQDGWNGKFEAWMIEVVGFDPEHPLSKPIKRRCGGICTARDWVWSRKGAQGVITLRRSEEHLWSEDDDKLPWEPGRYRSSSRLIWVASDAGSRLTDARRLEVDSHAFADVVEELRDIAWGNIERQWTERKTEQLKQEFLSTGHAEDWPVFLERQKIKFPYDARHSWQGEEAASLKYMIAVAIEHGFGTGELLTDVWARAVLEEPDSEELAIEFPVQCVGLILDFTEPPEEPDSEGKESEPEEDEEEPDDGDIAGFGAKIRDTITNAMAPEPEPEKPIHTTEDGLEILDAE